MYASGIALCLLALAGTGFGHPAGMECGTDASTRMKLGATIMGGPVAPGVDADGVKVVMKGAGSATVTAPVGMFFAAKIIGGGTVKPGDAGLAQTTNCSSQVYTPTASSTSYDLLIKATGKNATLAIGYNNAGPPGIKLISIPVVPSADVDEQ